MPRYRYKAKKGPGRTVEGELEAESEADAVASVDALGYSPIWVRPAGEARGGRGMFGAFITRRHVTVFTRQLAGLTKSAVPILRALSIIAAQTPHPRFKALVEDVKSRVRDGRMLSEGLAEYPRQFSELYVNMVRAGESGGVLDVVLDRLADSREKEEETRRKIQAAIAYPVLILSVGFLTVFVLLAFFLPKVLALFKDYENLPLPTRMLIGISDFFSANWFWILAFLVLGAAIFTRLSAMGQGRTFIDNLKLRIPLLGQFIVKSEVIRMARTLSLLIESGISIDRAIELSANALNNEVLKDEIITVKENTVRQGASFSDGLRSAEFFPAFVGSMCSVGEEAGRLDESLSEVAEFYEREVEHQSRLATSLLEPILILLVGAIVGFIVAAMLLPVFRLGSGI
jgi:type II secretory pathway component PulF